jgi:DNA-binding CsgD family transcriptional regulator
MLNPSNRLTKTEQVIFEIIGNGTLSNVAIGEQLNLSPHTIKNHKENMKKKLDCPNTVALFYLAIQNRLIQ